MSPPDLFSADFAQDPYRLYRIMRDEHPLYFHEPSKSWIVSRYDDVERGFVDPRFSTQNYEWQIEPVYGRTILQMDGREHSAHRNLLNPIFRGRDLQDRLLPLLEEKARELIDVFRDRGKVDLVAELTRHYPVHVIVGLLGFPPSEYSRFQAWYESIIAFFMNVKQDPAIHAAGLRTRAEVESFLLPVIAERRAKPGPDFLSTLCSAEIDGARMTDDEVRSFCSIILTAGGETTHRALASLFKNLLEHPDQLARVRADPELYDRAFAETLRFSPPGHMMLRQTTEPVELSGGTIPAGATVTLLIGAANRDDRRFRDPDTFDIQRDDLDVKRAFSGAANHLAFGGGRHFCVGAMFARAEMAVATRLLFEAMPDFRSDGPLPPEEGFFSRSPESLPLVFTPQGDRG